MKKVSENFDSSLNKIIQALLKSIPGKNPAGKFLLYDLVYSEIQDLRTSEDDNLPQGIWQRPLKKVDWNKVESLCLTTLETQSKDLQIAAWLTESWLHLYGLEGLRGGLELICGLCEQYWDSLYPLPRDSDVEFRFSPFEWMNEKLLIVLRLFPLTAPASEGIKRYTFLDWQFAIQPAKVSERNASQHLQRKSDVTLDQFNASKDATPTEYYQEIKEQAQQVIQQIQKLNKFIGIKTPSFSGILSHLREEAENIRGFSNIVLSARSAPSGQSQSQERQKRLLETEKKIPKSLLSDEGMPVEQKSSCPVTIDSREEAYWLLEQVAAYLSAIEPHSPTPLLIRRAIAWGQMSLAEVLQELVQDKNDLLKIQSLLGISKIPEEG